MQYKKQMQWFSGYIASHKIKNLIKSRRKYAKCKQYAIPKKTGIPFSGVDMGVLV